MSSTYDRFRQAAALMEAAEKAGLAAPSAVGVDNYSAPSIQTPFDPDAFVSWVQFTNAKVKVYPEPYSGATNLYANGEVDGLKVRLYTGAEITEKVRAILDRAAAPEEAATSAPLVSGETIAEVAEVTEDYRKRGGRDGLLEQWQVGDRVKIIAQNHGHGFAIGELVTLDHHDSQADDYRARSEISGAEHWVRSDEFEAAQS